MKKNIKIIIVILSIIIFGNWSNAWINFFVGKEMYSFQTFDKKYTFRYNSIKGGSVQRVLDNFSRFCLRHPEYEETQLYRTFAKQPLHFWNWYDYFTAERYKYPYRDFYKKSRLPNMMRHLNSNEKETVCFFFHNNKEKCKYIDKEGNPIIVDTYKKNIVKLAERDSITFYVSGECFVVEKNSKIDTCNANCVNLKDKKIKSIKEMQRFRELSNDLDSFINNPYEKIYLIEILNNEQFVMYPVKWKY